MHTKAQAILVLTCDMPYVSVVLLHKLIEIYQSKKVLTLFYIGETLFPFPGIYQKESSVVIKQRLDLHDLRVIEFIQTVFAKQSIDGAGFRECFVNIPMSDCFLYIF